MKPQTNWDRVTILSSERKPALFLDKASHCTTPSWQKMVAAPFALIKVPTETYASLFLAEIRIEPSPFWTSEVLRFFSISYTFWTWVKNIKILSTEKFEINKFISSCIVFLKQCLLCEWISLPQLLQPRWGIYHQPLTWKLALWLECHQFCRHQIQHSQHMKYINIIWGIRGSW